MSVQFGIATMVYGNVNIGYLQNVNVDISYETAKLYAGNALFPVDVRTHTGAITGSAEFADVNAVTFEKLLGGTRTGSSVDIDNTDSPTTFQMVTTITTDSVSFVLTFVKVRSTKLSLAMVRDSHLIPNFDFEIQADASGNIATIDVGDVS